MSLVNPNLHRTTEKRLADAVAEAKTRREQGASWMDAARLASLNHGVSQAKVEAETRQQYTRKVLPQGQTRNTGDGLTAAWQESNEEE